jgi:hypothetical protein
MKNNLLIVACFSLLFENLNCQVRKYDTCSFFNPCPKNYEVRNSVEIESLFPMFFYGGYHLAVGYRFKHFRIRASIINGGTYNAERAGLNNNANEFSRYYSRVGAGIFIGYNVWKNLEIYSYIEQHHFKIEQKISKETQMINSTDFGIAASYQIFIGKIFYVQPGLHFYFRKPQSIIFSDQTSYTISTVDISPVVRIGIRFYRSY